MSNSDNYAHPLSTEADSDPRLVVEVCGYAICEDSDQPGMWVWMAPSDGCDISYETRELALAAAWQDAVAQTLAILDIRCERWGEMTLQEHSALVLQALASEDAVELERPQV